ncbi:MAG TPA: hypothetical protein VF989_00745 [Polyangiaceae bacterium]|jgi:hypothetical protein
MYPTILLPRRLSRRLVRRAASAAFLLGVGLWPRVGGAAPCDGEQSPCLDANALWFSPFSEHLAAIADAALLEAGAYRAQLAVEYLRRPVVLVAPSADPEGRDIELVRFRTDATLLLAFGLGAGIDVGVATPFALRQRGTGVEGVTSTDAPALERAALRDPRLELRARLFDVPNGESRWFSSAGLGLLVPAGDESLLAGERGWVAAPRVTFGAALGHFGVLTELGARVRKTTELGGFRLGHQLTASLGAHYAVLGDGLLELSAEATALPVLSQQPRVTYDDGSRALDAGLIPAEWWVGLGTRLSESAQLRAGAGGGLPLSFERLEDSEGRERTEHFQGVTVPSFRVFVAISIATADAGGAP